MLLPNETTVATPTAVSVYVWLWLQIIENIGISASLSANNQAITAVRQALTAVIALYTYKNTYKFRGNPRPIQNRQNHRKSRERRMVL